MRITIEVLPLRGASGHLGASSCGSRFCSSPDFYWSANIARISLAARCGCWCSPVPYCTSSGMGGTEAMPGTAAMAVQATEPARVHEDRPEPGTNQKGGSHDRTSSRLRIVDPSNYQLRDLHLLRF